MPHNKLKHARALRNMGKTSEARMMVEAGLAMCPAGECNLRGTLLAFMGQLLRDEDKQARAMEKYKEAYAVL